MATILLFDVDGTLLLTGGAGRRAMNLAFLRLCGDGTVVDQVDMRGMTDPAILAAGLVATGFAADPALEARLTEAYLEALEDELPRVSDFVVMPGVDDLLLRLSRRSDLALGLGTGNVERGARLKLERAGLATYFEFGGFASDSGDRAELLAKGAARGASRFRLSREECRLIVIGDTRRDIDAGLAVGAEVLAVGTGGYSPRELMGQGATLAVEDLTDPRVLPFLVGQDAQPQHAGSSPINLALG